MNKTSVHTQQDASAAKAAGLYVRVSSDAQDTQRQIESVTRLAERSYPDLPTVTYFEESGVSASKVAIFDRPQGQRLCTDVAAGKLAVVIADEQSRFVRGGNSAVEWATFYALVRDSGTAIHTELEGVIRDDDSGELIAYLRNWDARREIATKTHRTKSGKLTLSKAGYWPHGKVPLGFDAVEAPDNPRRKILAPNHESFAPVEAFRMIDEDGASQRDVARYLAKALGRSFDRSFPRVLLRNPVYIGKVKHNGEEFDGAHPRLVSVERFERVQRILDQSAASHKRQPQKWPFAGVLRCPECGRAMRFRRMKGRYVYLICENPNFPTKTCNQGNIPASLFEANFCLTLGALAHELRLRLHADPSFAVTDPSDGDLSAAQDALTEAKAQLKKAVDLIFDGSITRDDPRYQDAKRGKDAAEERVRRLSGVARSHRETLEMFVRTVEGIAAQTPRYVTDWIDREDPAAYPKRGGPDVIGERFIARVIEGWKSADLDEKHSLVTRCFDRIEADSHSLSLHFRGVLHDAITLAGIVPVEQRADVEEEGFGSLDLVSANGSTSR